MSDHLMPVPELIASVIGESDPMAVIGSLLIRSFGDQGMNAGDGVCAVSFPGCPYATLVELLESPVEPFISVRTLIAPAADWNGLADFLMRENNRLVYVRLFRDVDAVLADYELPLDSTVNTLRRAVLEVASVGAGLHAHLRALGALTVAPEVSE